MKSRDSNRRPRLGLARDRSRSMDAAVTRSGLERSAQRCDGVGELAQIYFGREMRTVRDEFMQAAIAEAELGAREGGIPIGSVIVHREQIIGRGHNRRVQQGSAIRHGEMDALENAGRQPASVYRESVIYTTLSPCADVQRRDPALRHSQGHRRREPDIPWRGGTPAIAGRVGRGRAGPDDACG